MKQFHIQGYIIYFLKSQVNWIFKNKIHKWI
jgi:hypothetical protein